MHVVPRDEGNEHHNPHDYDLEFASHPPSTAPGFSAPETAPQGLASVPMSGNLIMPFSPHVAKSIDNHIPGISISQSSASPSQVTPSMSIISQENGHGSPNETSSQLPGWDYSLDRDLEKLLTGDDFDLDAINLSLQFALPDYVPTEAILDTNVPRPPTAQPGSMISGRSKKPSSVVQRKWHTFLELSPPGQTTPDMLPDSNHINESYRKRLVDHLQQRVQHGILPSTPFLDLCIQAYFWKFHPLFPVVHTPTFRPSTQNAVLLLAICSAGSLFVGSSRAISHGISMFERLNKAILSSWETYVNSSGVTCLVALQACIIEQTFGLLMGRPKDLMGIEMWHGSIIAWARKARLFEIQNSQSNLLGLDGQALEDAWSNWAENEVKKRIVLGLYIHDAELARLHRHEPILRHSPDRLPQISSAELFTASSAEHWKYLMLEEQTSLRAEVKASYYPTPPNHLLQQLSPSEFALSGILESISGLASEARYQHSIDNLWDDTSILTLPTFPPMPVVSKCQQLLTTWYTSYHPVMKNRSSWLSLMMLWHSIYLGLHADINALECATGREGYDVAQKHTAYAKAWARSANAKRCLSHAILIQKNFESLPAGSEPPIYVPMCLYYCGLIWASFMTFGTEPHPVKGAKVVESEGLRIGTGDNLHFTEFTLQGLEGIALLLEQLDDLQPRRLATRSLFRVINLMQRIVHWKIAQRLAATLLALVEETQDLY